MARSPWSKPAKVPAPSAEDIARARELARELRPTMQIGYKTGLRANLIAGINARLEDHQLVKVELVKIKPQQLAELIVEIEAGTGAVCVLRHGVTATFLRRHPNKPAP